jgi:mannobiose 2-epimerase
MSGQNFLLFIKKQSFKTGYSFPGGPVFYSMRELLETYRKELQTELTEILAYWMKKTIDEKNGGFVGRIDGRNQTHPDAPKGSVLNSRILWSFSAAYNLTKTVCYLQMAQRAFAYLHKYFIDKEHGGVYWTVSAKGEPLDTKKQIYALSFAIYGLSEYYQASGDEEAKTAAIGLYRDLVKHSHDKIQGGYVEAFSRDWKELDDFRLSAKDANERKSMNTHLHVLEGFANLYRIWPDEDLKGRLVELIRLFLYRITSNHSPHLVLFFEEDWTPKSAIISYGHDIEAAWLIQEAVEMLDDQLLKGQVKDCSVAIAKAAEKGLDRDGGLWYEYDAANHRLAKEKHWWPQAEAMIGFFNAWQNTGDKKWLDHSLKSWAFVQKFIRDGTDGEWRWGVNEDLSPMRREDRVGIWKCPYHNSRACIEISKRINCLLT